MTPLNAMSTLIFQLSYYICDNKMSKYERNNVLLSFSVTDIYVKMKQRTYSDQSLK